MQSFSKHAFGCFGVLWCTIFFVVLDCEAQTVSTKVSDNHVIRERIAIIFRETLKQGDLAVELNGHRQVRSQTFFPPLPKYVDEIRRYGDNAIPILAEYLHSVSGFDKYLSMRFLGLIGGRGVVEPLREVALYDPSSSFRLTALLWLAVADWDLAAPIIKQIANSDSSPEVREKAKEILLEHVLNK
jgi:hypothetical protein